MTSWQVIEYLTRPKTYRRIAALVFFLGLVATAEYLAIVSLFV